MSKLLATYVIQLCPMLIDIPQCLPISRSDRCLLLLTVSRHVYIHAIVSRKPLFTNQILRRRG